MRATRVSPSGVERSFDEDELIVTKTDLKGVLTYANDVFLRVSALTEDEAVGQPHNVIRHPDMPRAVFKLLWETIGSGREIFAYVLNLAADGAHYWVFAHVTPSLDPAGRRCGYHSSRRRPDPGALAVARELYAALRAEERRHTGAAEGLAASWRMLHGVLEERGVDYDRWVWDLTGGAA